MISYLRENVQFLILLILWVVMGIYVSVLAYAIIPLSFLLFWKRGMYKEMLIGFFYLLILSDSFYLPFAKTIKPVIIFLLGFFFLSNQQKFRPLTNLHSSFIPFFIIAIITLVQSETLFVSIEKLISYILLFMCVPNFTVLIYREYGNKAFKEIIIFTSILLLIGLLYQYINVDVAISHGGRFRGIFGNPNGVAMFCVFFYILFAIINEYYPDLLSRGDKLYFFVGVVCSIILSGSRNSMVCVLIFYLFYKINKISPFLIFVFFIFIAVSFQMIESELVTIIQRVGLSHYFRLDTLKSGSGRGVAWAFAWEHIQKNLFFGKGFDYNQYLFLLPKNRQMLNMLNHQGDVHNVYLGFWLDVGLVGLILFFTAFFYLFYKASKATPVAVPMMYSLLFMSNYEPWLIASLNPYTIQFLMTMSIILYCKPIIGVITAAPLAVSNESIK